MNLEERDHNYEMLRWDRQKFTLSMAVAVMAVTMAFTGFFYYTQQSLRVEEYTTEALDMVLQDATKTQSAIRILEIRLSVIENELVNTRSLLEVVRENQKAQETLIHNLTNAEE